MTDSAPSPSHRPPPAGGRDLPLGLLPHLLTPLVDREQEVASLISALTDDRVRLLTLTGVGGVGKSCVALEVAHAVTPHIADGVALVDVAGIGQPSLLLPALAAAVGWPHLTDTASTARLAQSIGSHSLLLVLDNADHLAADAQVLVELLQACPHLAILVTSRSRLRLRGEVVRSLLPLPVPPAEASLSVEAALAVPAVRLFMARAGDVAPEFALDPQNVGVIAEIVRRLDGLPLAIELAASRLDLLSPQGLLARLDHRLPVLTGGSRDLPDRLQTMRAAIAWSYDLLPANEQELLASLSVFADTIPLTAATAVSDESDDLATLDQLGRLTERSLLIRDDDQFGEPRFRWLQTVREFARERLQAAGNEREAMTRLLEWCLDLAESAAITRQRASGRPDLLARLEAEQPTLREVLTWLETHDEPKSFVRLAGALGWYWLQRSHRREGRRWLEAAVAQAEAAGQRTLAVARALDGAAVLAFSQGDLDHAHAVASRALALSTELVDRWGIAGAWNLLGAIARARGDAAAAEAGFTTARDYFTALGDPGWVALATLNLGTIAYFQGKTAAAVALMEDARQRYEALDDAYGQAIAWSDLGRTLGDAGDLTAAQEAFARSLVQWRRVGTREGLIDWLTRVATLAVYQDRPIDALRWFSAAELVRSELGYVFDRPERERQRGALEQARLGLGEERVTAAWDAGRALSLDEAVADAGRALPTLQSPSPVSVPADAAETSPAGLTPREMDVLRLLVEGRSDRQIGDVLFISHRTVMRHVENILGKLQVESRTAAATFALRQGYV